MEKTDPTPAQLRAIAAAREERRGAASIIEERTKLLKCLATMLKDKQKPVPESDIASKFYGANTPTNRRKIQRHLEALHGGKELHIPLDFGLQRKPVDNSKSFAWTADIHTLNEKLKSMGLGITADATADMTRDRALALALARKYLRDVMPRHLMDQLENDFNAAEAELKQVITREGITEDLNQLRKRVDMTQRGQRLVKADVDTEILDNIYIAITTSRCISFDYQAGTPNQKRHSKVSVAGVLLRAPKLYLYGLRDGLDDKPENYSSFQINLISNLEIHKRTPSRVTQFDMHTHVQDGHTDVLIDYKDKAIHEIKIEVTPTGNLIRDLQDFPLSKKQTLKKQKNGNYLLNFPSRRTHQLLEYIVGRGSAFEVIAPDVLVADIKKALTNALAAYQKPTNKTPTPKNH